MALSIAFFILALTQVKSFPGFTEIFSRIKVMLPNKPLPPDLNRNRACH
jgi:hypothetical protein